MSKQEEIMIQSLKLRKRKALSTYFHTGSLNQKSLYIIKA
jgi:hypothetical protein